MPDTQQMPSKDDSKQMKKLLESHLAVLEHKLGRPPTMEELTSFLNGTEQTGDDAAIQAEDAQDPSLDAPKEGVGEAEPKVLSYKVYTGMKSEGANKVADPRKILFYETADGRVYDTTNHEWCHERPAVIDHLQSRPMLFDEQGHDIMSALVNGVLDDEDYGSLDKAQMLNDHHKKVWDLSKQLESQMVQLEKSMETEQEPGQDGSQLDSEFKEAATAAVNAINDVLPGENVLEQIIAGAMEQVMEMSEQRVRDIVAAEFNRHMSAFVQQFEQTGEPTQEFETQPAPAAVP